MTASIDENIDKLIVTLRQRKERDLIERIESLRDHYNKLENRLAQRKADLAETVEIVESYLNKVCR